MDAGTVYGRGLAFPPRLGPDGRVAWTAGPANVRDGMRVVLLTEPGERLHLPGFGSRLRSLLGEPNTVATRHLAQQYIQRALEEWEPRIALEDVLVEQDPDDTTAAIATISYRLVATQAPEQVTLRVQFGG